VTPEAINRHPSYGIISGTRHLETNVQSCLQVVLIEYLQPYGWSPTHDLMLNYKGVAASYRFLHLDAVAKESRQRSICDAALTVLSESVVPPAARTATWLRREICCPPISARRALAQSIG
jgi:hypothetical protein